MPTDPNEKYGDILFPTQGIDLSSAFGQQRTGTTPVGNNVRAYEPGTQRARGGSRPGLSRYINAQVDGSSLLQELNSVTYVSSSGQGGGTTTQSDQLLITQTFTGIFGSYYLVSVYLNGFAVGPTNTFSINRIASNPAAGNISVTVPGCSAPTQQTNSVIATTGLTNINTPLTNIATGGVTGNVLLGPLGSGNPVYTVALADANIPGDNTVSWIYQGSGSYVDLGRAQHENFQATLTWTRYAWSGNSWTGGTNGTVVQTGVGNWLRLDFKFTVT